MRTILFFDLPTLTSKNLRDYRHFVKDIQLLGFYRIQESVFVKMSTSQESANLLSKKITKILPKEGCVFSIQVTETQFSKMNIYLGEMSSEVESSDDKVIVI
ncbi:MAG: CRISPR-associated endonuclease Cas2 [Candidatus Enterosoma sp.]|nr:CRISPR-associated endonuclease Cas2 [Bacilli bacterium]MDD7607300.1 CRISPR-associated endonuclease Cas2 [bacterium]MDY3907872.1 CRISPR-associated endonuclease Cas2 [Candidatus Enterosoma sp.]MDY5649534.1 CRISPR-associated endonuclease Cas2 [Candidatus Enterosoma sp.]MDY5866165.1 CRISPR-associated endonuclease Cas2 [Candidatus Enterosoma sp.]